METPKYWVAHMPQGDKLITDPVMVADLEGLHNIHCTPLYTAPYARLSVIDPDEWVPCSPEYLENRKNACRESPRVWCEKEKNHYHPKNWPVDTPLQPGLIKTTIILNLNREIM